MYFLAQIMFIKTQIMFVKTQIIFVKTQIMLVKTQIIFVKTQIMFVKTQIMFVKTQIMFLLYFIKIIFFQYFLKSKKICLVLEGKNLGIAWRICATLIMRAAPCLLRLSQTWPASICLSAVCGQSPTAQPARLSSLKIFFFSKLCRGTLFLKKTIGCSLQQLYSEHSTTNQTIAEEE